MVSFHALFILFHEQCKLDNDRSRLELGFLVLISILVVLNTHPLSIICIPFPQILPNRMVTPLGEYKNLFFPGRGSMSYPPTPFTHNGKIFFFLIVSIMFLWEYLGENPSSFPQEQARNVPNYFLNKCMFWPFFYIYSVQVLPPKPRLIKHSL
jgi:hypothetical protein